VGRLNATPEHTDTLKIYDCPILIKQKVKEKKKTVEISTDYKHQRAKDFLTQELKQLLNNNKNDCIQIFLQGLTPTKSTDYSLWKVIKKIKQAKKPSPRRTS
jgi:hypothetical protein